MGRALFSAARGALLPRPVVVASLGEASGVLDAELTSGASEVVGQSAPGRS